MPDGRPAIPAELKRRVLVEAGHRCAIPTCRQHPVDIEHIDDWASVREHQFENLIALCPTCHRRKGSGPDQIDRKSLRQYKANLAVINGRYGDLERRLIALCAETLQREAPEPERKINVRLGAGSFIHLMYLIQDGYLVQINQGAQLALGNVALLESYQFTDPGIEFVRRWADAQPLDEIPSKE
ncbi:HNH endonuclease [Kitasatospora sp. NBC_01560]|uniref:HNH endonuclease n=1 Tax=Kitasatospora sp. NBC_01560 TaxID=2975965 RepID=UPI00386A9F79